jgi:hypothetical protein
MKIYCLDREDCCFYRYLSDDEYKVYDFDKPFIHCENCDYVALIVPDDFVLENNSKTKSLILSALNKLDKL